MADPTKPGEPASLPTGAPPKAKSELNPTEGDTAMTAIQIANEIKSLAPHHRARAEHAGYDEKQWADNIAENIRKLPPAVFPALHAITWHLLAPDK